MSDNGRLSAYNGNDSTSSAHYVIGRDGLHRKYMAISVYVYNLLCVDNSETVAVYESCLYPTTYSIFYIFTLSLHI